MLSWSRRLLRELDVPPRQAVPAAAAVALVLVLVLGMAAAFRPRPSTPDVPAAAGVTLTPAPARVPPTAALGAPGRRPFPPRGVLPSSSRPAPAAGGSGGWWFGTAGVALAVAVVGWGSVASRRYLSALGGGHAGPAPLRVVGRTSLSPKHTVYLLEVGDRVLLVGTGPQGAPALIGELDGLAPAPAAPDRGPARFDHRLGDDES